MQATNDQPAVINQARAGLKTMIMRAARPRCGDGNESVDEIDTLRHNDIVGKLDQIREDASAAIAGSAKNIALTTQAIDRMDTIGSTAGQPGAMP